MQMKFDRFLKLACVAVTAAALSPFAIATQPVQAADYIGTAPAASDGSICSQSRVLGRVAAQFNHQVRNVPHLPQVAIASVGDIRLTRYEPKNNPAEIERSYCKATAAFTDGQSRSVWYLVEGGQGFAGIGNNVEMCVDGFDRWHVYDSACRTLR